MKNIIVLDFLVNADGYFRSPKLRNEFLKLMYDTYMEKNDIKGRSISFEEANKYFDLEKYCKKQRKFYSEKSTVTVRHTFFRDGSAKYAEQNGLVDEWNKKTASIKNANMFNKEGLDNYVKGQNDDTTRAKAKLFVDRTGTEEDKAEFEKAKVRNIKIGRNATFEDSTIAYKLYKEHGLTSPELKAYIESKNLDYSKRNGLISYYIDRVISEDNKAQEYKELNESIRAEKLGRSRRYGAGKITDKATRIIDKFLSYNEKDLDIALAKYNQDEKLTKEELFKNFDRVRLTSKNNPMNHVLYVRFMDRYSDNEEIIDNKMYELFKVAQKDEEVAALEFLYVTKKTPTQGVRIIRGMVDNNVVVTWDAVPLKRALSKLEPDNGLLIFNDEDQLVKTKYTYNGQEVSIEDKEQALKLMKENGMEITSSTYTSLVRCFAYGKINIYGNTKEEIFGKNAKTKVLK